MNQKELKNIWWIILTFTVIIFIGVLLNYIFPDFTASSGYTFIKDLITLALTVAGLITANKGLFTWKDQFNYNKEAEIANGLKFSVLKLRDAIKHVRNPAIWNTESYEAIQRFKNKYPDRANDKDLEKNANGYVYEMRWEEITKAYTEMESHLLEAEVLWGNEVLEKVRPLKEKVTKLNVSLRQYLQPELRTTKSLELHEIVYDQGGENDEDAFSKKVTEAVKEITSYINQKLS